MIFSPKEATEMSRDIKYIGMDVHKEAIVIAVLNGSGKLVMETILETKASSILQFIHGLRGELHVTWEEGRAQSGLAICAGSLFLGHGQPFCGSNGGTEILSPERY
jgi:hypothetical protein